MGPEKLLNRKTIEQVDLQLLDEVMRKQVTPVPLRP
jgi:hypothetical protein